MRFKQEPSWIAVDAYLAKSDIAEAAAQYGARNSTEFRGHAAGTLELITFAGRIDLATRDYVGAYLFRPVKAPTFAAPTFDFGALPGMGGSAEVPADTAHESPTSRRTKKGTS